jgi:hypothetical protein
MNWTNTCRKGRNTTKKYYTQNKNTEGVAKALPEKQPLIGYKFIYLSLSSSSSSSSSKGLSTLQLFSFTQN